MSWRYSVQIVRVTNKRSTQLLVFCFEVAVGIRIVNLRTNCCGLYVWKMIKNEFLCQENMIWDLKWTSCWDFQLGRMWSYLELKFEVELWKLKETKSLSWRICRTQFAWTKLADWISKIKRTFAPIWSYCFSFNLSNLLFYFISNCSFTSLASFVNFSPFPLSFWILY